MSVKIYIDAGHGGSDPGAVGNGLREKDITLQLALLTRDILTREYNGVTTRLSRDDDRYLTLKQRTDLANAWGANLFVSIHVNSSANTSATGYEDFISDRLADTTKTAQLRNAIHAEVAKATGLKNRGKKKANYHVLRESKMSAVLTEVGFISNASDASNLRNVAWLEKVARGHAEGIAKAFGLSKKVNVGNGGGGESMRLNANVKYEGKSVKAFIEDGRTYAQVRDLAEMLGLGIEYVAETKTVKLTKGAK